LAVNNFVEISNQ